MILMIKLMKIKICLWSWRRSSLWLMICNWQLNVIS